MLSSSRQFVTAKCLLPIRSRRPSSLEHLASPDPVVVVVVVVVVDVVLVGVGVSVVAVETDDVVPAAAATAGL